MNEEAAPPPGPGDGVQIDVVRHLAGRMIVQVKFDEVAFADANETSGNFAAEGPEKILDAIGKLFHDFLHFEFHDDLGGVGTLDGRRNEWGLSEDGDFLALNFGIDGFFAARANF